MLRFAPSPTSDMDIGTLRLAILNYLVSQQRNAHFLVRINDTNKAKNIEGKDTEIMQILEKFALKHDSVFHQSEHLHMHQMMAIKLLEQDKAFICTCTEEELASEKEKAKANNLAYTYSGKCLNIDKAQHLKLKESGTPFVLRLKKPAHDISYHDLIQGDVTITPDEVDAFMILREDSTPTDIFASACDDMLSGISMILQEESSCLETARQIHIQKQLDFDAKINYVHIPSTTMHLNASTETSSVKWLFAQGFIPDAIINYLLLLGNKEVPQEIFTLPQAIEWFDLENIAKVPVLFDMDKLRFINKEHLKLMDDRQLSTLFGFADAQVGQLAKLYLQESSTINELALKIRPIFAPKEMEAKEEMFTLQKIIADAPMIDDFNDFKRYLSKNSRLTEEELTPLLRHLLTGANQGPELSDIYPLIKSYLLEIAS